MPLMRSGCQVTETAAGSSSSPEGGGTDDQVPQSRPNTSKERAHSLLNQGLFYFDCLLLMRAERAKPLMAKFDDSSVSMLRFVKSSASYEGIAQRARPNRPVLARRVPRPRPQGPKAPPEGNQRARPKGASDGR